MNIRVFFLLTFLIGGNVFAADYALVINAKTQIRTLSVRQVRDIFMMKRHFINNIKIIPVNILSSLKIRSVFEKNILKTNRDKLNNYWIKQHFQGIQPPTIQSSAKSMKLFIKNVDGALGYLPKYLVDDDLRVIREF